MKKLTILTATILWCVLTSVAAAVDYHVAQKNPSAGDNNPGAADKPFKTIAAGVAKARLMPGDTLYVHQGVYRETVDLRPADSRHGQAGAHIRIIAWPKEVVEIKGSDVVTDWRKYDGPTGATTTAPASQPASNG